MPAKKLTADWIEYLKRTQIAAPQSDPKTGKLNYQKKVTTSDLVHFLQNKTDFGDDEINNAIETVVSQAAPSAKKAAGSNLPTAQGQPARPTQQPPGGKKYDTSGATDVEPRYGPKPALPSGRTRLPSPSTKKHDTSGATDVEPKSGPQQPQPQPEVKARGGKVKGQVSQTPGAVRKRQARSNRKAGLNEDIIDEPGEEISEKDVEKVFAILGQPRLSADGSGVDQQKKEVEQIKSFISGKMQPKHRKQLWDLLQGSVVTESQIDRNDANQILYSASKAKGIDINDLHKSWKAANYPLDTDGIANMLNNEFQFSSSDINKVFNQVLGNAYDEEDEEDEPKINPAITKLVDYIKKKNLTKEVVDYMQKEFGAELTDAGPAAPQAKPGFMQRAKDFGKKIFGQKATTEDVRRIFTLILKEERKLLPHVVKNIERTQLGRNRK